MIIIIIIIITEWMDLVVWGHEHECNIIPAESAVGTFRITQPGSSVATSLTEGESLTKHVGILDIRGQQFRLLPVPLMQVRSFAMGNIILSETGLDAEDLRVDDAMQEILAKEVEKLIREARSSSRLLKYNNERGGGGGGNNDNNNSRNDSHNDNEEGENEEDDILVKALNFHVEKPERVLVRLKVEHSGFSTLHNQRFGSRFVNEVANPSDILLFHRKRVNEAIKSSSNRGNNKSNNTSNSNGIPNDPTYPKEMEEINFEDIVKDLLDDAEKKLQILNEDTLTIAVEEFVSKEQKQMITETVSKILNKQQKSLVKRGGEGGDLIDGDKDDTEVKLTTVNAVREVCQTETQKIREAEFSMDIDGEEDEGEDNVENNESPKKKPPARKRGRVQRSQSQYDEDDNDEDVSVDASIKEKKRNNRSTKTSRSNGAGRGGGQKRVRRNTQKYDSESEFEEDDDDEVVVEVPTPKPKKRKAPAKRRGRAVQQQQSSSEDDDDDVIVENISPPSRRNRSQGRAVGRGSRRSATKRSYEEEVIEIDDNDNDALESSGWGTACSQPTPAKRSRRRK
jgi:double-strand break repair protein MRE11